MPTKTKLNIIRTVKFCPKCQNTDLIMVAGGEIGMWECKNCGFRGTIFPEKEFEIEYKQNKK